MSNSSYLIPPPNVPIFLYKFHSNSLRKLIEWAKAEHRARLIWCAENGYYKELKRLNEDYSPMRVLAELTEYHKICATITKTIWNSLSGRERVFLRRAYEVRDLLRSR
jgi:hypothetical protein